ncbi:hypothetical protein M413DRAFT_440510 [Hebeloma cylindrosporum]|uniref:5-formyltetrahydrofolate cyclo-ligase n=1 Tax=Hebeloma cylindrosporum TaxID=76867 RepID=A0A0C2Z194_HEBCY|nr:hypothetical protein M413DRAFT_440510 [Hebeloma cylindrosporum h7]
MAIPTVLKAQKRALRKAISATLSQLPLTNIEEQSQEITARVLSLTSFKHATSVSCYLSMPSGEVRTPAIVDAILASGKTLFVPKIQTAEGNMDFFRIHSADDLASLPSGTWGIKEPDVLWQGEKRTSILGSTTEGLDMILLPGVAFDRSLSRLGHGKGYYDRFVSSYVASGRPKPLLVGLGLREQLLYEGVPMADHDWKLDVLVTPDGTLFADGENTESTI